ncbi:MAG TPA: hypothetical protein VI796_06710 [Candidatus Thermoplasmatota archaeon]|nr:hypothetical protein [Candidatus Thermoplasmatota archaeon]
MGIFDVPMAKRMPWGILALVFNVLPTPGVGTLIAAGTTDDRKQMYFGIAQFLGFVLFLALFPVMPLLIVVALLAWIWSILWGVLILMRGE